MGKQLRNTERERERERERKTVRESERKGGVGESN